MLYNKIPSKTVEESGVAVIYHWWDMTDTPISQSINPIIPSIASLRAVNKKVPIYVLDSTGFNKNWNDYPEKYDFYVVKWPFEVNKYVNLERNPINISVSTLLDVWQFSKSMLKEGIIVYCDCDTFWFDDALPTYSLNPGKLSIGANCGIISFNKNDKGVETLFEIYKAYCITAMNNKILHQSVATIDGTTRMSTQAAVLGRRNLLGTIRNEKPNLFYALPEQYTSGRLLGKVYNPKMVHVGDLGMKNRGDALVLLYELYDNICGSDIFTELDWVEIYGALRYAKLRQWQVSVENETLKDQLSKNATLCVALEKVHKTKIRNV